jgi:flagellar motor switch protein FliG
MSLPANEETVSLLLWTLSDPETEILLTRLDGPVSGRLRSRLIELRTAPPEETSVDAAVKEFFDFQRIADRTLTLIPKDAPLATPSGSNLTVPSEPTPAETSTLELKQIEADKLLRAIQSERPAVIALVLSLLEPAKASNLLKGLPPEVRPDVVLKMSQPAPDTPMLLEMTVRAVIEKCRNMPSETKMPSGDDRVKNLAQMLRGLARDERKSILESLDKTDPDLVSRVVSNLYRVEDMLRVEDRSLQVFLQAIDVRTLAGALKGAEENLMKKVTANLSNRAKETLAEEMSMQANLSPTKVKESQAKFVEVFRSFEEQDKLTFVDA